jgi:hypothetical protein
MPDRLPVATVIRMELRAAEVADRPVLGLRITMAALRGSVAALPVTPERARLFGLLEIRDHVSYAGVIADPKIWGRSLELLVHPADWMEVLADADCYAMMSQASADSSSFCGLKVVVE